MKMITREIIQTRYEFGKVDVESGSIFDVMDYVSVKPMTKKEIADYCKANGDCLLLRHSPIRVRYTLPVERFISACEQYAEEVKSR